MQVSLKKSITLVELIISITLLGVIILGATAFHIAGERFLTSSETKTQVLNELTFILQHLRKNILVATGDITNIGINITILPPKTVLEITQESRTVQYEFGAGPGNRIRFRVKPPGPGVIPWEILTESFIDLGGLMPFGISLDTDDGGLAITNLALRLDPTSPKNDSTNPEVTTIDTSGGRTVYFYSLSHSW